MDYTQNDLVQVGFSYNTYYMYTNLIQTILIQLALDNPQLL